MRWMLAGGLVGLAAALIGLAVYFSRAAPAAADFEYPQSTPDEVLQSAIAMIERGEARRLPDLIYADSDEMRAVLNRLGRLLQSLQTLAATLQSKFPEEVDELRAKGAEAALTRIAQRGVPRTDRRAGPREQRQAQETLADASRLLLADPYGWIERNRSRLTTLTTADNVAAIMVDGKPAFGLGVTMRRDNDRWRVALPINLPGVARFVPRNHDEWAILASMIQVVDNAVVELDSDVRAGRVRSLNGVAELAGEKAWMPMAICFVAYQKAMDARSAAGAN